MTPPQLNALLNDAAWAGTLLHLLPRDHFNAGHLPGASCACVYEMDFLEQVKAAGAEPGKMVVVYGDSSDSAAAATAQAKLSQEGYQNVDVLEGGMAAWLAAGFSLEGGSGVLEETPPHPADYDGVYGVDTEQSVIRWTGRNALNHHEGTLRLKGGELELSGGDVKRGRFAVDMETIACADLTDSAVNAMLIRHLRDEDFFAVDRFPEAEFRINSASPIAGAKPGVPNYQFAGTLRLRGVEQEIEFPATVADAGDGRLSAQAQFEIDRTRWGVLYGSSKFFNFLGKHLVNDHIHLHLKIHVQRRG